MLAPCPSCGLAAWNASPIATIRSAKGRLSIWWPYRASVISSGSRMASRSGEVSGQSFRACHLPGVEPLVPPLRQNPPASGSRRKPPLHSRLRGGGRWAARRPSCWRGGSAVRVQMRIETCSRPRQARPQRAIGKLAPVSAAEEPAKAASARRARRRPDRMGRPACRQSPTRIGRRSAPRSMPVIRPARLDRDIPARTASNSTLKSAARCTPSPNRLLPSR